MLIVFDDEKEFREAYKSMFPKMGIDMPVVECSSKEEIRDRLKDPSVMSSARVLVFDLSASKQEAEARTFDILTDINENYRKYPIPIFIHSAFAHEVEGYDNLGTLFRVKKSSDSLENILNKIKLFYDSGFLDIFSPGGYIEKEIHHEIHQAFIEQFRGDEVFQIIESISHSTQNVKERTKDVFLRIAVRSLFQNLMSEKAQTDSEKTEEIRINAVEHYYRRKSSFPVWTGDIFIALDKKSQVIILTPRCDINIGYCNGNFLTCAIEPLEEKRIKEFGKAKENIQKYIDDNPQNTGIKSRYLIPTPAYPGGRIDLTNYNIINQAKFSGEQKEYEYLISLSDELTNDVVRKFTSYLMRGGISASELGEASFYSAAQSVKKNGSPELSPSNTDKPDS